jgi:hypothetical protein
VNISLYFLSCGDIYIYIYIYIYILFANHVLDLNP